MEKTASQSRKSLKHASRRWTLPQRILTLEWQYLMVCLFHDEPRTVHNSNHETDMTDGLSPEDILAIGQVFRDEFDKRLKTKSREVHINDRDMSRNHSRYPNSSRRGITGKVISKGLRVGMLGKRN